MSATRFGAFVRQTREARKMTGVDLARAAGYSPQYLHDIEHGRRLPSTTALWDLARALDLDVFALHAMAGKVPNACVPASYEKALAAAEAWRKATKCAPRCPREAHTSPETNEEAG